MVDSCFGDVVSGTLLCQACRQLSSRNVRRSQSPGRIVTEVMILEVENRDQEDKRDCKAAPANSVQYDQLIICGLEMHSLSPHQTIAGLI